MQWFKNGFNHYSGSYRIYLETRGNSAWFYGKSGAMRLGRDLTLPAAQTLCEQHKAKAKGAA